MRIQKNDTLALVIDFQERLYPLIDSHEQLTRNVPLLLEGLGVLGIPVVLTEQYRKGLGPTVPFLAEKLPGVEPLEKLSFSCCDEPSMMERIERSGKRTIVLCGIETHICVLQTAIDLVERGYHPVVVADCVSSRTACNKQIGLERMKQEGVRITSYESVLFELCRVAGTDVFKAISKLVK